ncbi:DNA/RNA nuclease SfsA [Acidithiobacillus sp.]|uniref:DNA/RNA nuclease SfsA n=1 Tax=Acidithiobacillus sp. TaxID=1872118 RepID=UPI0025C7025C|nr:DNA/RNA nuclease SfsA [Acidithiobacillus sp.]
MQLPELTSATLLRRYRRFLADCRLEDGRVVTVHCPNSGSMRSCATPGQPVLLSYQASARRKYPWTWELYWSGASWVCINTQRPNAIVAEAIGNGRVPELEGYPQLRREVPYGDRARIDMLLMGGDKAPAFVEVKSCTMLDPDGVVRFPDAVSLRARRHLEELEKVVATGARGVLFFLMGREDGQGFAPAASIDPHYAEALRAARRKGVEILAYRSEVSPDRIILDAAETLLL